MITPLGLTTHETWAGILAGKSGVGPITCFDASQFTTRIAACVKNFDSSAFLSPKEARKFDLFIQYGIGAAHQAMVDSGLEINEHNAHRMGVAVGSGIGGLPWIE